MSQPQQQNRMISSFSLYALTGAAAQAADLIEEIINSTELAENDKDAQVEKALAEFEAATEAIPEKLDGCAGWIKSLQRQQEAIRAEEIELARKRHLVERQEKAFRSSMLRCLWTLDGHKIKRATWSASVSIRKESKVEITDEQMLPRDIRFWRIKKEPAIDAIKEALKSGEKIPGATLIDTEVLQIR